MPFRISRLFLAIVAFLPACAPVDMLNATISTAGLTVTHSIAYGDQPRQMLDIYRPSVFAPGAAKLPVAVFFYGGSWNSGARDEYKFVAAAIAKQGIVVIVPDYRLYPQVQYPVFLQDCASAVAWAQHHAGDYDGDTNDVTLVGHSAGAYNVAMLTLDPDFLIAAGGDRDKLAGAVTLAGPFDFLPMTDPEVKAVFAPADDGPVTQPINHVDGHNPPMLLLHGNDDDEVYPRNTTALTAKIRGAGGPVQDKFYEKLGHVGIVLSFAPWFRGRASVLEDVVAFIKRG